jgi:hypothetical protein
LHLSCWSEPEPTEGKLQANSSSRISLLLSMSCVLYGQPPARYMSQLLADWRNDYKQVVQEDEGILDPFLFLQHQVMVISFLVPLSIIHSYCTPGKTANSCTVVLYPPEKMTNPDKSSRQQNVELGDSAIGPIRLQIDVQNNE